MSEDTQSAQRPESFCTLRPYRSRCCVRCQECFIRYDVQYRYSIQFTLRRSPSQMKKEEAQFNSIHAIRFMTTKFTSFRININLRTHIHISHPRSNASSTSTSHSHAIRHQNPKLQLQCSTLLNF